MHSVSHNNIDRRAVEYQTKILDYLDLWQAAVTTRVNNGNKNTDTLRREVDHYNTKLESLNSARQKRKTSPTAQDVEKMERNRQKFEQAKEVYQKAAVEQYVILDEVENRSWRDLHPILTQLLQLDAALIQDNSSKAVLAKYEASLKALRKKWKSSSNN